MWGWLVVFALLALMVLRRVGSQKSAFLNMDFRKLAGRVYLIVTAHPDDESMFMLPTITNLVKAGKTVNILCLSNGNADGLGKQREKEMEKACGFLGVTDYEVLDQKEF